MIIILYTKVMYGNIQNTQIYLQLPRLDFLRIGAINEQSIIFRVARRVRRGKTR